MVTDLGQHARIASLGCTSIMGDQEDRSLETDTGGLAGIVAGSPQRKQPFMDSQPDREIARGLRAGEPGVWNALYDAYFDRVWRSVARAIGPGSADVGDVVQETFLAAARSARAYDPARGSLWMWLSGIARNHVGDYFRNRKRDGRLSPGGDLSASVAERLGEWLARRDASPPEALASAEAAALVRMVLGELPSDYRQLLNERYCDGTTAEGIAKQRGASAGSIRSKLARARRAFREVFAKYAICPDDDRTGAHHES